jgi:hypothetical protein
MNAPAEMWQPKMPMVIVGMLVAQQPNKGNGLRRKAQQHAKPVEALEFHGDFGLGVFSRPVRLRASDSLGAAFGDGTRP